MKPTEPDLVVIPRSQLESYQSIITGLKERLEREQKVSQDLRQKLNGF